jgi:hypothetical protein
VQLFEEATDRPILSRDLSFSRGIVNETLKYEI